MEQRLSPANAAGRSLISSRSDCPDEQLAALNAWRRKQEDPPTHAEAIRQLMETGLAQELYKKKS